MLDQSSTRNPLLSTFIHSINNKRDRRSRGRIVGGSTATCAISVYHL